MKNILLLFYCLQLLTDITTRFDGTTIRPKIVNDFGDLKMVRFVGFMRVHYVVEKRNDKYIFCVERKNKYSKIEIQMLRILKTVYSWLKLDSIDICFSIMDDLKKAHQGVLV
ncbi:MAG: hypothetical protein EXX96DRAFT_612056 [Benjaminiella poitrasii]|nr:MAG: hypothetical protein EXX96DRAFT_612056 [Benjaminiella poitrasii]